MSLSKDINYSINGVFPIPMCDCFKKMNFIKFLKLLLEWSVEIKWSYISIGSTATSFLLILQNISSELRQIPFELFPYFLLRKIFFIKFSMPPILSQRLCDKVFYITILNNRNASPVETFRINLANIFHTQQH